MGELRHYILKKLGKKQNEGKNEDKGERRVDELTACKDNKRSVFATTYHCYTISQVGENRAHLRRNQCRWNVQSVNMSLSWYFKSTLVKERKT